ncbi:MAG: N-acetylmuramoyl-L-alanine amidase-like domain-containing protein, partial [Chthoniobacterales bacterium]
MRRAITFLFLVFIAAQLRASMLPMSTIFRGQDKFEQLVAEARANNWASLPIGERTATVGRALVGTRYKPFTLEIDNRIESPSVNLTGLDCWTFFETSLAFARMIEEP